MSPAATPPSSQSDRGAGGELRIEGLSVTIPKASGDLVVLEDVSLDVPSGKFVALVGGSGAGKSMTACAVLKLFPVTARITAGRILFNGTDLVPLSEREMQAYPARRTAVLLPDRSARLAPGIAA